MFDREVIYECIPDASREQYGKTREEQIDNFIKQNPDIFGELDTSVKLETAEDVLEYIVLEITKKYGTQGLAYKGGYILNKRIPNCRRTFDVDLSIEEKEIYTRIKEVFAIIGNDLISKGLIVSYEIKPEVTKTISGGIKFIREDGAKVWGVDVGLHSLGYGITTLKIHGEDLPVFTIERSLADKLSVLCSHKRFRRIKDMYDIYMLTSYFDLSYDALSEALIQREVNWNLFPVEAAHLTQLNHAYSMLKLTDSNVESAKPQFVDVVERISAFCSPWLNNYKASTWEYKRGGWK